MTLVAAVSRLNAIYGAFALLPANGITISSEYNKGDIWQAWAQTGNFYIEFNCTLATPTGVVATDDLAFAAQIATMEAALKIPRQRLLVSFATVVVLDWTYAALPGQTPPQTQTAFGIRPELTLLESNSRDYRYAFRVKCEYPGAITGNDFRRESSTQVTFGNTQRRICSISAEWTMGGFSDTPSGPNFSALTNYTTYGDAFFTAALPASIQDQHGNSGAWVLAATQQGPWDDEVAKVMVTRVYWEVFNGRQDSQVTIETLPTTVIGTTRFTGRRVCRIPSRWAASGGNNALQNYLAHGTAYFASVLPTVVSNGEWVLVEANPTQTDEDPGSGGRGVIHVTHTYHEVVLGLREFYAKLSANEFNARTLEVSGTYYATAGNSAQANYNAGIAGLVSTLVAAAGITHVDAVSAPRNTGNDTTGLRYTFNHIVHEIIYPQGATIDDANVLLETIDLKHTQPFEPQSQTPAISVTRLNTVKAIFTARIDAQTNTNPTGLWEGTLRAATIAQVLAKLGTGVTQVLVVGEEVGPLIGDQHNLLTGTLWLIVTGGGVLSMKLVQRVTQRSTRDFVGRGDGVPNDYFAYRKIPKYAKELYREGWLEYVIGGSGTPPAMFATGDLTVSGYGYVDPSVNAQTSLDNQAAAGALGFNAWMCELLVDEALATDRGDGASAYQTVMLHRIERWIFMTAVDS